MNEPSVEEIVRAYETAKALGLPQNYLGREYADALIADWRKRGEALERAQGEIRAWEFTHAPFTDGDGVFWYTQTASVFAALVKKERVARALLRSARGVIILGQTLLRDDGFGQGTCARIDAALTQQQTPD